MNEASLSARLDFSERRLALMEQRQMTRVWGARAVTVRQPVFPHGRLTHEETGPVTVESYAPATDGVGFPTTLTCIIHIPFSRLDGLPEDIERGVKRASLSYGQKGQQTGDDVDPELELIDWLSSAMEAREAADPVPEPSATKAWRVFAADGERVNFALQLPRAHPLRHWDEYLVAFWRLLPISPYADGDQTLTVRIARTVIVEDEDESDWEEYGAPDDIQNLDEIQGMFAAHDWSMRVISLQRCSVLRV